MTTVIIFIILLAVLVLVHELGHFWTALWFKMKVEEFGVGFPPRAWSKMRKGIRYSINWLPLGGFVKIKGENGEDAADPESFASKKPWQRIIVLSAGVIMNFLLAAFLLGFGFMFGLPQAIDGVSDQASIRDQKIQIINVLPDSPAAKAELAIGDAVHSFNGEAISSIPQLLELADKNIGKVVSFEVVRGAEVLQKEIEVITLESTGKGGIGIGLVGTGVVSYSPPVAIYKGFEATYLLSEQILVGFWGIIKSLVSGLGVGVQVSGPVGIAVLTGQVAQLGFIYLLQFAAILSINLAIINFLPFPALDGGRVVFVLIEKLRGRPVSQKVEGAFHAAGMALLLLLIVVVTFQDVFRYLGS